MTTLRSILFASAFCACAHAQEFVGTTPCGGQVRDFLGISRKLPCDKITWQLTLSNTNSFKLTATYGLQEKSAPGYIEGGTTVTFEGTLQTVSPKVSQIILNQAGRSISLARVNDNLLQLLDLDKKMLIGNEFWSYTLSRKNIGRDH